MRLALAPLSTLTSALTMLATHPSRFWQNVLKHDYTADEVCEEIDSMMDGGSWVDWNDGRTT